MTKPILAAVAAVVLAGYCVISRNAGSATAPHLEAAAPRCFTVPYYTVPVTFCVETGLPWRFGR